MHYLLADTRGCSVKLFQLIPIRLKLYVIQGFFILEGRSTNFNIQTTIY